METQKGEMNLDGLLGTYGGDVHRKFIRDFERICGNVNLVNFFLIPLISNQENKKK